ncbi:glycosyltransferase [Actinoplanes sp. NPDC051494]|uniref:glycosyltransferase n=1 Tax=Actinoplanes sp. NPDC051494 TaxID=3363907 RepID=UPI00379D0EC0
MTCAAFEPGFRAGGPIKSVAHILDGTSEDVDVTLITRDRDLGDKKPYAGLSGRWVKRNHADIFYLNIRSPRQWLSIGRFLRASPPDLIYINSLFTPTFSVLPVLAARTRMFRPRRLLVAPRGELSPGALELKSAKKLLFLKAWRRVLAGMPVTWHASTTMEAADIERNFPGATILVNQDQSGLPKVADVPRQRGGHARFVFVSRISPKKNLKSALVALQKVRNRVDYDIYGPIEDKRYWNECQEMIDNLPANVTVEYKGHLAPDEVRATFAQYDAFLFPTHGENFGHVIAESLSVSCPVICSDQTPWTQLLREGAGWVTDDNAGNELSGILERLTAADAEARFSARIKSGVAYERWQDRLRAVNVFDELRARHDHP